MGTSKSPPRRQPPPKTLYKTTARKRLYTVSEAAEYLGRSVPAMRHLIANGVIPVVKIGPKKEKTKRIHIDQLDLDKLISKSKIQYKDW